MRANAQRKWDTLLGVNQKNAIKLEKLDRQVEAWVDKRSHLTRAQARSRGQAQTGLPVAPLSLGLSLSVPPLDWLLISLLGAAAALAVAFAAFRGEARAASGAAVVATEEEYQAVAASEQE